MPRPRRHAFSLALVLAVVAMTTVADADHAWGSYHWARTSNPFTLLTGDNVSALWDAHLDDAIADWNPSTVLDLQEVPGGARPKNCRPTAGRIEVCNSTYGNTGWLGIAQIWVRGTHITQAVAKLNDTYFNSAPYNTPDWRQLVMCQEIAHDFGLDHQDENFNNTNLGSCMDYTSDPDGPPSNTRPNNHDFEQLVTIYAHNDNTTTVGAPLPTTASPAMSQMDFDSPGQWGRLVRSTANGRVHLYELDFGGGYKVVTHVFWADPAGDRPRGR